MYVARQGVEVKTRVSLNSSSSSAPPDVAGCAPRFEGLLDTPPRLSNYPAKPREAWPWMSAGGFAVSGWPIRDGFPGQQDQRGPAAAVDERRPQGHPDLTGALTAKATQPFSVRRVFRAVCFSGASFAGDRFLCLSAPPENGQQHRRWSRLPFAVRLPLAAAADFAQEPLLRQLLLAFPLSAFSISAEAPPSNPCRRQSSASGALWDWHPRPLLVQHGHDRLFHSGRGISRGRMSPPCFREYARRELSMSFGI